MENTTTNPPVTPHRMTTRQFGGASITPRSCPAGDYFDANVVVGCQGRRYFVAGCHVGVLRVGALVQWPNGVLTIDNGYKEYR